MPKTSGADIQPGTTQSDPTTSIEVLTNGPYRVRGPLTLQVQEIVQNAAGQSWSYRDRQSFDIQDGATLCRCGHSRNKPYCDGSHVKSGVDLSETAAFGPLLPSAAEVDGPRYSLTDNEKYCAFGRFCDNGQQIWNEVRLAERQHADLAVYMAHQCPSGRLVVWDNQIREPVEEPLTPSLALIEDPALGVSGPLLLRGGVRVQASSGQSYEIRNRQTLCRCGASSNKPFCDGSHASTKFQDGL